MLAMRTARRPPHPRTRRGAKYRHSTLLLDGLACTRDDGPPMAVPSGDLRLTYFVITTHESTRLKDKHFSRAKSSDPRLAICPSCSCRVAKLTNLGKLAADRHLKTKQLVNHLRLGYSPIYVSIKRSHNNRPYDRQRLVEVTPRANRRPSIDKTVVGHESVQD
jgi:hypothetical protein